MYSETPKTETCPV